MEKEAIYKKSLDLLDQFISNISKEELSKMISEVQGMNIQGPTFDQYLELLQEELGGMDWIMDCSEQIKPVATSNIWKYNFLYCEDLAGSPPWKLCKSYKKDSAVIAESFFLL